jgi:hypothetical protein
MQVSTLLLQAEVAKVREDVEEIVENVAEALHPLLQLTLLPSLEV